MRIYPLLFKKKFTLFLTVRTPELFYKLMMIDTKNRRTMSLCPFVKSGKMHKNFQKHLRKDGRGIDYSKLLDFDTLASVDDIYRMQRPGTEDLIRMAMNGNSRGDLQDKIVLGLRLGIDKTNPQLIEEARKRRDSM